MLGVGSVECYPSALGMTIGEAASEYRTGGRSLDPVSNTGG
jgi:hypothetical protein